MPSGVNLRLELLDPMIRSKAAETPGVELILGHTATTLMREGNDICGVEVRERNGQSRALRARLVIGADGRGSRVAELAGVATRTIDHGRFFYAGYFEGLSPVGPPDGSAWFLDPDWAAAFPTDNGLTLYAAMPTKKRQDEFRRDPIPALVSYIAALPDAPPILASRMVRRAVGKIDIPNVIHAPTHPGLALVGNAALATDPYGASAAAGRCSPANGSPTASPGRCSEASPCSAGSRRTPSSSASPPASTACAAEGSCTLDLSESRDGGGERLPRSLRTSSLRAETQRGDRLEVATKLAVCCAIAPGRVRAVRLRYRLGRPGP